MLDIFASAIQYFPTFLTLKLPDVFCDAVSFLSHVDGFHTGADVCLCLYSVSAHVGVGT